MSEEKMREAFEAVFFNRQYFLYPNALCTKDMLFRRFSKGEKEGQYLNSEIEDCWFSWKSATSHMQEEVERLKAENAKLRAWYDNVMATKPFEAFQRDSVRTIKIKCIRKPEPLEE